MMLAAARILVPLLTGTGILLVVLLLIPAARRGSVVRIPRLAFRPAELLVAGALPRDAAHGRPIRTARTRFCRVYALVGVALGLAATRQIILTLIAGAAGAAAAWWYFSSAEKRWQRACDEQLLQALDMVARGTAAGQSLLQALSAAIPRLEKPLGAVLAAALREVELGTPLSEALARSAARIDHGTFHTAVLAINLARETGGSLSLILGRISDSLRERAKITGRIAAITAQGRASGMIIAAAPGVLLVLMYLLEPGMTGLMFSTFAGNLMLLIAAVMVGAGLFFIDRIIRVEW